MIWGERGQGEGAKWRRGVNGIRWVDAGRMRWVGSVNGCESSGRGNEKEGEIGRVGGSNGRDGEEWRRGLAKGVEKNEGETSEGWW